MAASAAVESHFEISIIRNGPTYLRTYVEILKFLGGAFGPPGTELFLRREQMKRGLWKLLCMMDDKSPCSGDWIPAVALFRVIEC